ncbi:MAG TPA: 4-hydroxy-tetrahydrodipicolinate reductase [Saprospiraceae bacterium]|nr:4-hydroxy-tetrahydrodipicolinate reductase [Saprospiraceae bacterium]
MKVALIGYGKMGKEIESLCKEFEHAIPVIIRKNDYFISYMNVLATCDVAIEFTQPDAAFDNIKSCMELGLPVVSGTTGWQERMPEIEDICHDLKGAFLYSSNFSLGVNLLFYFNKKLGELFSRFPEYQCTIQEIHHTQKKDAPSGTAITLANDIVKLNPSYNNWSLVQGNQIQDDHILIESFREDDVPGTHIIQYYNDIEILALSHESKSRKGFALGAIKAAEWLIHRTGVFTMEDVLSL